MIITVSQGGAFRFDVDRFPCKNRGGFMDNMLWGNEEKDYNSKNFKQLTDGKEFYETTLPYAKIVPLKNNPSETFWIYFNQTYNENYGGEIDSSTEGVTLKKTLLEIQNVKSYQGSGGDYLSNEIFYRVAKLRTKLRPNLATGHLHIPKIQEKPSQNYHRGNSSTEDINPKINEMISKIAEFIKNFN